jgi:glucan phosphorylase
VNCYQGATLNTNLLYEYPDETADLLARLKRLARNLWWTWNQECQEIFQELSPRGWQDLYHNAMAAHASAGSVFCQKGQERAGIV